MMIFIIINIEVTTSIKLKKNRYEKSFVTIIFIVR